MRMRVLSLPAALVLSLVVGSACLTVGPDFETPEPEVVEEWPGARARADRQPSQTLP